MVTTKISREAAIAEWRKPFPNEDDDAALKSVRDNVASMLEILSADIDELESRLTPSRSGESERTDQNKEIG